MQINRAKSDLAHSSIGEKTSAWFMRILCHNRMSVGQRIIRALLE